MEHLNKERQLPTSVPLSKGWTMTVKWKHSQDTKDRANNILSSKTVFDSWSVKSPAAQLFYFYFQYTKILSHSVSTLSFY